MFAVAVVAAGLAANEAKATTTSTLSENFNAEKLDRNLWWMRQAHLGHYAVMPKTPHATDRMVAIRTDAMMRGCGRGCQRNEIRIAPHHQLKFGTEATYSFSFRLAGKPSTARWVSGQWKQQSDGSPFLAQRFDRGIFSITVQDDDCRVTVASSNSAPEMLPATRATPDVSSRVFPAAGASSLCRTDIRVEYGENPVLPDPYRGWVNMTYRLRGGCDGNGLVEIWANGQFVARVTGSIGIKKTAGPRQYFKFGIYRNFTPGTATAYFDNFRRTTAAQRVARHRAP